MKRRHMESRKGRRGRKRFPDAPGLRGVVPLQTLGAGAPPVKMASAGADVGLVAAILRGIFGRRRGGAR